MQLHLKPCLPIMRSSYRHVLLYTTVLVLVACTSDPGDISISAAGAPESVLNPGDGSEVDQNSSNQTEPAAVDQTAQAQSGSQLLGNVTTDIPEDVEETAVGSIFVSGPSQLAVYTYADDADGQSNCLSSCAETWPPLLANEIYSGENPLFSTIERDDRSLQWAFKNRPLYSYRGDSGLNEINGNGLDGKWFVARPDPFEVVENQGLGQNILVVRGSVNAGINEPSIRTTDIDGDTLYIYTRDVPGFSNCNAGCAEDWPPLYADQGAVGAGRFSVITRSSGQLQWAHDGWPLYLYVADSGPGDTSGENVGGVWFVVAP